MKALVYKKGGRANAAIVEVPNPVCGDNQVLVRVMACGICKPADSGHDRGTSMMGSYPVIPGHEFAGIVETIGKCVTRFKPGDRVAVDNGAPCGTCYYCKRGEFAFCENYRALGQSLNGGFAQLCVSPEDHVYAVPDNVPLRAAALSELVGCAFHCIERCQIPYSGDVLVLGCGASGMLLSMMAKSSGAGTVTVVDSVAEKLKKIASKGVDITLIDRNDYPSMEATLMGRTPHGFDVIIDAAGDAELIEKVFPLLKAQGTFVNYSFPSTAKRTVGLDMALMIKKDLNYIGTTFQHHRFDQVLRSISTGKVDPMLIVSDIYSLDNYFEALDKNLNDPQTIKILIEPNGSSKGL